MKKSKAVSALAIAALSCISFPSFSADLQQRTTSDSGYSYFRAGFEYVSYDEVFPGLESSASVLSPVINTGGLYRINDHFDFSLEALATFSPGESNEEWHNNQGLMQTNKYQYIKASTNALLHYKMTTEWRVVAGPAFSYQTHKRFARKDHQATNPETPEFFKGTWEESSTDVFLDMGVAYDTGTLHNESPWQYQFRALIGLPLWSTTTNTAFEDLNFYDFSLRGSLEGGISYRVYRSERWRFCKCGSGAPF